jgi:hypothetical protein
MSNSLTTVLDSGSLRVAAYCLLAAQAFYWYVRERGAPRSPARWPTYWLLTGFLSLSMGVGRAGAIGDLVSELGREQARSSGWYEGRRSIQAIAVAVIAGAWVIGVIIAIWRVPPRRRRYLPSVVVVSTLVMFAMVRLVSLHQIDTVLYRRDIAGVRIVALVELLLLALTGVVIAMVDRLEWSPFELDHAPAQAVTSPEPSETTQG